MHHPALRIGGRDGSADRDGSAAAQVDGHARDEASWSIDPNKFENVLQIGGIRTGWLDFPNPNGGQRCRVAFFNTGGGLQFTVAVDRGGDIVDATYNGRNLAYLTQNDYAPPSHAYLRGKEWLAGWSGGLVTTCGPMLMGEPRHEDGADVPLHGHHSNTPASIDAIINPDPQRERWDMSLSMTIRDTRMFGPSVEVRRTISAKLGGRSFRLADEVINRGDRSCPHAMLYHLNFGYPLLDEGARLIMGGRICQRFGLARELVDDEQIEKFKVIPRPAAEYRGANESILVIQPAVRRPDPCRVGVVNKERSLGVEVKYSSDQLPRLGAMLHCAPRGSYMAALEPFSGSITGKAVDPHPEAHRRLAPGGTRQYELSFTLHSDRSHLEELLRHDSRILSETAIG